MTIENVMDNPNISKRNPLNFADSSVLNPISKQIAKTISADVAIIPSAVIMEFGNQGFINSVYSKKLFQFPQAETSLGHIPNRSATADKNPTEIAIRKNTLTAIVFISFYSGFL